MGSCINTPTNVQLIINQLLTPLNTELFHWLANGPSVTFGPYPPTPFSNLPIEAICFELNAGAISAVSSVISYTVP